MGFSQSNIRLNNYWENTYYINPASIYSEYKFIASVAGRKQWIEFPGAPNTEYILAAARINTQKNIQVGQIGIKAFRDEIGYTKLINISTSYSYSIRLKKNLLMNLGIAFSFQQVSYDMTQSKLETIGDPVIGMIENQKSNNADLGVEFIGKSILIGAASQNLGSLFTSENKLQTNSSFLYVMHRERIENSFYIQSGICAIKNEKLNQLELNVSGFLNPKNIPNIFQLGVFYRTRNEFGVLLGIDLNESVRLACSYDYNVSGISHNSIGTSELMLIWKFGKLPDCKCRELYK